MRCRRACQMHEPPQLPAGTYVHPSPCRSLTMRCPPGLLGLATVPAPLLACRSSGIAIERLGRSCCAPCLPAWVLGCACAPSRSVHWPLIWWLHLYTPRGPSSHWRAVEGVEKGPLAVRSRNWPWVKREPLGLGSFPPRQWPEREPLQSNPGNPGGESNKRRPRSSYDVGQQARRLIRPASHSARSSIAARPHRRGAIPPLAAVVGVGRPAVRPMKPCHHGGGCDRRAARSLSTTLPPPGASLPGVQHVRCQ